MQTQAVCATCGNAYLPVVDGSRFCSRACFDAAGRPREGSFHAPNATCVVCGRPYWVQASRLSASRFCSNACKSASHALSSRDELARMYYDEQLSMQEIADQLNCSVHKVGYWVEQYGIERRDISDALYIHKNPDGDPFKITLPETTEEKELFALTIGLYMGEGAKKGIHQVSLANTNPATHRVFLQFLEQFCGIPRSQVSVWINIFDDCDVEGAIQWWIDELRLNRDQFYAPVVRESRGGTYTNKSTYGTLSVAFHNIKLKKTD